MKGGVKKGHIIRGNLLYLFFQPFFPISQNLKTCNFVSFYFTKNYQTQHSKVKKLLSKFKILYIKPSSCLLSNKPKIAPFGDLMC
jgi:hypothetical protein